MRKEPTVTVSVALEPVTRKTSHIACGCLNNDYRRVGRTVGFPISAMSPGALYAAEADHTRWHAIRPIQEFDRWVSDAAA